MKRHFSSKIFSPVCIENIYFEKILKICKCYYNILKKKNIFFSKCFSIFLSKYCEQKCLVFISPISPYVRSHHKKYIFLSNTPAFQTLLTQDWQGQHNRTDRSRCIGLGIRSTGKDHQWRSQKFALGGAVRKFWVKSLINIKILHIKC